MIGSCFLYLSCYSKVVKLCCMMVQVIGSYCFYMSCCGFCYVLNVVVDDDVYKNLIECNFSCCHDAFL